MSSTQHLERRLALKLAELRRRTEEACRLARECAELLKHIPRPTDPKAAAAIAEVARFIERFASLGER